MKNKSTIHDCKLIELPKKYDRRGSLTYIYNKEHIPFDIQRTFFTYDVPGGEDRGAHAHQETEQFLVSAMGAFEVRVDDGDEENVIRLERAFYGLYIPTMIWAEQIRFSSGGICLVMASTTYKEGEYVRDYNEFLKLKGRI
ncbi:MAG: WxcM-like domain-containing protein [Candidatus Electrothrix sp. AR4]|nr:WxcM-like domain-containing protein [Candidatus Electrothrix sp. AR4]